MTILGHFVILENTAAFSGEASSMDTIAHFYREINSGFLSKGCGQGFEISYLAEYDENDDPLFSPRSAGKTPGHPTQQRSDGQCLIATLTNQPFSTIGCANTPDFFMPFSFPLNLLALPYPLNKGKMALPNS